MATPLYCRKCGTRLPPESPFCPACGAFQFSDDHTSTNLSSKEAIDKGTGRLPPGQMLRQRYRLVQAVGQGGMGAVYVAQDTQLGDRSVAVKEMSISRLSQQELPQAVAQFQREAHLLASLHHPNLPAIYDYFHEANRWYLVMSFIEGYTLQSALDNMPSKKLPINEVIRIGIELCDVLDYLHTHQPQVVFRDLKPSNIMLTPKGHVFLIDFGIARHFKQEQMKDTLYCYSVGYAPLEQYGQSQTSPRSDIYSLGATLHQMLSGHHPASRPFQFPALHLIDPTTPIPLANLITQMLEMNEQARPASVVEVKEQLELALTLKPIEPTKQAEIEYEEESQQKQVQWEQSTPLHYPQIYTDYPQTSLGIWSEINAFFAERRITSWVCFIILSLFPLFLYNNFWAQIGALIPAIGAATTGLLFLLNKEKPLIERIGGIALVIFGSILPIIAYLITRYENYHYYYYDINYIIIPLNVLWLLVGTRFFLRRANVAEALIFGVLLLIIGFVSYPFHIWNGVLLSFPQAILGVFTITVAPLRRRQRKRIR